MNNLRTVSIFSFAWLTALLALAANQALAQYPQTGSPGPQSSYPTPAYQPPQPSANYSPQTPPPAAHYQPPATSGGTPGSTVPTDNPYAGVFHQAALPQNTGPQLPVPHQAAPTAQPAPTSPAPPNETVETVPADPSFWLDPIEWCRACGWSTSFELGINGTGGNTDTFNLQSGFNTKNETDHGTGAIDFSYNRSLADSVETQHNALLDGRYDWKLGKSRWTLFTIGTLEYDEFKAFDLRLAVSGGFGYQLIKTDSTTLTGRVGSGVSHEIGGPNDDYVPEAIFGLDFEQQISKRQKLVAKADYYPEWGDFDNYRLVLDAGWEVLLDEETNLSLKLAATDRYDSTPEGLRPNDINYSLLLLWKL